MITIRICDSNRKRFKSSFVDPDGTTNVSVPHGKMPHLVVFADKPDFCACIVVDGETALHIFLDAPVTSIALPVASSPSRPRLLFNRFCNLFGGGKKYAITPFCSDLKVTVRHFIKEGPVIVTLKFRLLDPISFAGARGTSKLWLNR